MGPKKGDSWGERLQAQLLLQSPAPARVATDGNNDLEDRVRAATWMAQDYDPTSGGVLSKEGWDSVKHAFSFRKDNNRRAPRVEAENTVLKMKSHLEQVLQSLMGMTDEMLSEEIQARLLEAEGKALHSRHVVSQTPLKSAETTIADVNTLISSIEETCSHWRRSYPDNSPIKIDNRAVVAERSAPQHTPTLVAYCMALANRVFDGASRRGADFMLGVVKLFGLSLLAMNRPERSEQSDAIDAIPDDIRTIERRFNLDVKTVTYAVCPQCSFTHAADGDGKYPERCSELLPDRPKTSGPHLCDTPLLRNDAPSGRQEPIKPYEYYPFPDWFGRFLTLPAVREYGDKFCDEVASSEYISGDRTRSSDGRCFAEFKGYDGKLFVADRGDEGRWFFALYGDFFNIEGNLIGGKSSSTGVMAMYCLNLPLTIRDDPVYVYVPGIIPGPSEPYAKESQHRHYVKPLVDDLLTGYMRGFRVYGHGSAFLSDHHFIAFRRLERVALAGLLMDFKASRLFSGHMDVGSHTFCHVCQCWHRSTLMRTDYDAWLPADDKRGKEAGAKWLHALQHNKRSCRLRIEEQFGTRFSEFHRLPYWRTSRQVVVDPMHTMFNRCALALWQALGLRNPGPRKKGDDDGDDDDDLTPKSAIAFYHDFALPPPLSALGIGVSDVPEDYPDDEEIQTEQKEWEDDNLFAIQWNDLRDEVKDWRVSQITHLRPKITPVHHKEMKLIVKKLSQKSPDQDQQEKMKKTLSGYRWESLALFSSIVLALPEDRLFAEEEFRKRWLKKDLANALVEWRVKEVVVEDEFIWPNFTTISRNREVDDLTTLPVPEIGALTTEERKRLLEELTSKMNYSTALGIGQIHDRLWKPFQAAGLRRWFERTPLADEALKYVCIDLNCLPPNAKSGKDDLVDNLVSWRLAQPLNAMPWPSIESQDVLERIHQAIKEVIVPSWTDIPPHNVGRPAAGTLKSDNWRVLFEIYVPLALLSLWKEEAPASASNAPEMAGALETAMHFTCASLHMTRRRPTYQDRQRFLDCWKLHIQGLKDNFPGCAVPSHHLGWHVFDFTDEFGAVHNFWCFFGERFLGKLRDIPINHKSGEFEGTLLHSYYKGCGFRQWLLLHEDRPGVMQQCMELVSRTYGYGSTAKDEDNGRSEIPVEKTPTVILALLPLLPVRSFRKRVIGDLKYTITSYNERDSYVCFNTTTQEDWLAGRIEYIFEGDDQGIKLVVRRCKTSELQTDPFRTFWTAGFEAKLVSTHFEERPEVVASSQLLGHTARWELSSDEVVVLKRSKD